MSTEPFVQVAGLEKHFPITKGFLRRPTGEAVHAVNGIGFDINGGETLGLVGESGCGKSTTARMLVALTHPSAGTIRIGENDITTLRGDELRRARREFQIIFQDPYGSLDPRMTVRSLIGEPIRVNEGAGRAERARRVEQLLAQVGLAPEHATRFPHEFSGGQRQRIGIARALALSPRFIVCDEPVSALDVSIQAQIVNLLKSLQRELGLTYLFVSHDLAIVAQIATRVAVMYLGNIVETGPTHALYSTPRHPYTRALLDAVPIATAGSRPKRALGGELPSPIDLPSGCPFHPRCPMVTQECRTTPPPLRMADGQHAVACHLA